MLRAISNLPPSLHFTAIAAFAMFVPSVHALVLEDFFVARSFFYAGLLVLIVTSFIAISISGRERVISQREHLLTLIAAFTLLPLILAIPFHEASRTTTFVNAYFEMVSSLTTTGATLFDMPDRLPPSLHLWRALVGWLGGLLIWVVAAVTLAAMNLGGFEVSSNARPKTMHPSLARRGPRQNAPSSRAWIAAQALAPIYAGLTLALWILLMLAGETSLVGICHAMSTLATSGISPLASMEGSQSGVVGEIAIFMFFVFALSRLTFSRDTTGRRGPLWKDPEFRMGLIVAAGLPLLLFLRHWIGAIEVNEHNDLNAGLQALWGAVFTVMSFMTTTGFDSASWEAARNWSGLPAAGIVLMGLTIIGGGVATTAGGVKLLRVYALYNHGKRELEKLVHPSSVTGNAAYGRRIHRDGPFLAWLFFMTFAISIAAIMAMLTLAKVDFQDALVFAVAGLSTTGPLAQTAGETALSYAALGTGAKLVLCFAMVLGRLEALALIALFNPNFWRN